MRIVNTQGHRSTVLFADLYVKKNVFEAQAEGSVAQKHGFDPRQHLNV